jgi:WD40 repeat protein
LEYVPGGSLADKIDNKPMPPREAALLVESLARAMQLVHSRNVVHRDLKPANVLLTADGTPKITDFGLARQLDSDSGETKTGAVMGTPSYMAPEQASGRANEAGPAADVYALGAILYDCLTGQPPFKGRSFVDTLDKVRTQEPLPPSELAPRDLQCANFLDLETICLKCLRKEPEKRYASAGELADELVRFSRGEPILARPVGHFERLWMWTKRNPSRAAFASVLMLLLVTVAIAASMLAVKERNAAKAQSKYNQDLLREQGEKDVALRNQRIGSARLALDRGLLLCEQGDVARGLVAMTAGLLPAIEADASDVESAIRLNLAAWEREMWPLQSIDEVPKGAFVVGARIRPGGDLLALALSNNTVELRSVGDGANSDPKKLKLDSLVSQIEFSADGRRLLTRTQTAVQLWDCATGTSIGPPLEHSANALGASVSPDGTKVAIATGKPVVHLWTIAISTQRNLQELKQSAPSRFVQFRPDGRELLTSENDTLRRWDAATGSPNGNPVKHPGSVWSAAYSRDSRRIASSTRVLSRIGNDNVYLWNAGDGKRIFESTMAGGAAPEVSFSPDGQIYAALSFEGGVQLRRTSTGELIANLTAQTGAIKSISFSPDSATLILGERNGRVRFWDISSGATRGPILYHLGEVSFTELSADGRNLLTSDGTIRRWRRASGIRHGKVLLHSSEVNSFCFSPDGKRLITGSAAGPACVWSVKTGERLAELSEQVGSVYVVAFSPKGDRALTAGADRIVRIWDTADWKVTARLNGHASTVYAAAFSPNSEIVLTGGADRTARFWNVASGQQLGTALSYAGPIRAVAFRPDGEVAIVGGVDGKARLWRVAAREAIGEPLVHQAIEWVGFTADGRLAITAGYDKELRLWDSANGSLVRSISLSSAWCLSVATSHDNLYLLTTAFGSIVPIRLLSTGENVGLPLQHQDRIRAVSVAPDGYTALTGSFDATARRWHIPTGFPVGPALRHVKELRLVEFSPDGRLCASGSWDGAVSLWVAPPPVEGDAATIRLRIERMTGVTADVAGSIQPLDADGWRTRMAQFKSQ